MVTRTAGVRRAYNRNSTAVGVDEVVPPPVRATRRKSASLPPSGQERFVQEIHHEDGRCRRDGEGGADQRRWGVAEERRERVDEQEHREDDEPRQDR